MFSCYNFVLFLFYNKILLDVCFAHVMFLFFLFHDQDFGTRLALVFVFQMPLYGIHLKLGLALVALL
jgi:hypothetical protein